MIEECLNLEYILKLIRISVLISGIGDAFLIPSFPPEAHRRGVT
jgi:hypothetical protein